jgi:uncharacterized membrane protein YcaP (DUF421 family)
MLHFLKNIFGSPEKIGPLFFALRCIVVGILLFAQGKILPRRAGGQFAGYDFTFFWMMGGLTAAPLFEAKISVINTVVVIIVMYLVHYLISFFAVKNRKFEGIVFGKAVNLMEGGKILTHHMKKNLIPLELLLSEIRTVDAANINEIEIAILETSGHISVLKKSDYQPVTPIDLDMTTVGAGLPITLINEGKVINKNLRSLGYDKAWLEKRLYKEGIENIKEIYFAMIETSGNLYYSVYTNNKRGKGI